MGEELSKEWILLERCAPLFQGQIGDHMVRELLEDSSLHWGEVLHQALRHRMLPLLAHTLRHHHLIDVIPPEIQEVLLTTLSVNRHVLEAGYAIIQEIIDAFQAQGIPYVVTKGYVLDQLIYRSLHVRKTSDIDIIVAPVDKHRVAGVLGGLGYVNGHFDPATQSIVEVSQQVKRLYAMVPGYMPEFVRRHPDPLIQSVYIDVGCSLTWFKAQYKIPVEEALATRTTMQADDLKAREISCLDPEYQLIYTALHLFKEAWVESYGIKDGNDVSLSKFIDVYLLVLERHNDIDRDKLAALIDRYSIAKPILWVLKHTERVFQADLCGRLGLTAPVADSWLASWQMSDQTLGYWKGTMRERLQSKDRRGLFL